jgi:hypothetical protein
MGYKYTDAIKYDFTNGKIFRKRKSDNKWEDIGIPMKSGHLSCCINGKKSYIHRVIYEKYYCIELTRNQVIDHIDLNPSNNKITNLRLVSQQQNCQNKNHNKNSKSGHKNISWSKRDNKYVVQIKSDGKNGFFGYFEKLEDAIKKRDKKIQELNKQGHIFRC